MPIERCDLPRAPNQYLETKYRVGTMELPAVTLPVHVA